MISVNINPAASGASLNLGNANNALQKSLARLSSGQRIVNSSDDAGGLAVSMKMSAALKRTEATAINLRNIQSYLDTQDGAFKVADGVLSRMSELTTLARDVTKNSGDVENYDKEFGNLKAQILSLATEKFNGVGLFENKTVNGKTIAVPTSEDGSQETSVTQAALNSDPALNKMANGFKKFGIQGKTFIAERINDKAEIYPDGPTSQSTIKNIYTLPSGEAHTLTISADPVTEPISPTTAGASAFTYAFGLNYDLDGVTKTETLKLVYPAAPGNVDDLSKPLFVESPANSGTFVEVLDLHGYPKYESLDDTSKPVPGNPVPGPGSPNNIIGTIDANGDINYLTPNQYTGNNDIMGFTDPNGVVQWFDAATKTFISANGPVTQQEFEPQKGLPPFIWRQVKDDNGNDIAENNGSLNSGMRWFNTSTGDYTYSLPPGGTSPNDSSSLIGFGYGESITPPQIDPLNANQALDQGNALVSKLLNARINGVSNATNLNNNSTHNTNLIYDNSADYGAISQLALQQLADMRAQNGAEMSRVNFAKDLLDQNANNLESANSRIMDVDIAAESSQLARFQILQQAGTAMLAQANTSQQALLRLLQGQ